MYHASCKKQTLDTQFQHLKKDIKTKTNYLQFNGGNRPFTNSRFVSKLHVFIRFLNELFPL